MTDSPFRCNADETMALLMGIFFRSRLERPIRIAGCSGPKGGKPAPHRPRKENATVTKRTLNLTKGDHTYVFRYAPGCEDLILDEIAALAEDDGCDLDWLDAATLGFQVARSAAIAPARQMKTVQE